MRDTSSRSEIVLTEHSLPEKSVQHDIVGLAFPGTTVRTLRLLWFQRRFLLRATLWGLLATSIVAFLIPSRYTSTARLMPPDEKSSGLGLAAAALNGGGGVGSDALGNMASELLGLKSNSDIFVGILNSRTSQDKLIQQFNLKKVYWDTRMEDARKDLSNHTTIDVDRKSQIITIEVTDKDKHRAAAMAGTYIEELNYLVAEMSTSSARRERIFLEGRLQTVNRDLEAAEKSFSQFASQNTAIDVPAQGRAMLLAAAQLQGELIAAESELEGLKQVYTNDNVRVRSVSARVAELQGQLEKLGGKGEGQSSASGDSSSSTFPSIRKLPVLGVTYADLYRQTRVQEAIYETLTKEYELAKVEEAKEIPTVKVLDPPNIAEKESFPLRLLIIFMGTVFACCLGVLYVLGSASWNATDAQDPGKRFAKEVWVDLKAHAPWALKNGAGTADANERALDQTSQQDERGGPL